MTIIKNQLLHIQHINGENVGGKANGLNKLMSWGLNVPAGFVIVNAQGSGPIEELEHFYTAIGGGKVAVRSSALSEDGEDSSFAGQYESVLNVEGIEAIQAAVATCVDSLNSAQASAYQQDQTIEETQMCVVVQCMVEAQSAGVLFSVDPVSGRHDRLVIDAVAGLGEALVSGEKTPDHYVFDNNAALVQQEWVADTPILTQQHCAQMLAEAQQAVNAAGYPLDMEWAIDQDGQLFWLQARPITTIGSDLKELDTPLPADEVVTRCNIGEMMPGASCPLTFSTTGRAIEYGMQHMHLSYASREAITDEWTQVAMCSGKMFLNLSGAAAAATTVLGVDVKSLGLSVCGRIVEELQEPPKGSILIRIKGMIKLLNYLKQADTVIEKFTHRATQFNPCTQGTSAEIASDLDEAQQFFYEAFCVHLQSSTTSGFASNVLQAIISGGQESTPEEEAEAAALMAGATGVESAVLVEQLDHIVDVIAAHKDAQGCFVDVSVEQALTWINHEQDHNIATLYHAFLKRHGHRSYRELCVREVSWADAPEDLIATMQASVTARLQGVEASQRPVAADMASLKAALRWILPKAHNAVRRREATKSLLVDITNRLKRSYRALGHQLVKEEKLDDADQVFFFTHKELMHYVQHEANDKQQKLHWNRHTKNRRKALAFQDQLMFDEICVGAPEPIDLQAMQADDDGQLVGRPVSRGVIEAKARVALSVSDAAHLLPGEILVAPITDVGWTPYFSMISGLITDVGSAVSHGAVIAREYGLPAIVNTRTATQRIKTGDKLRLDADTGIVTLL